MKGYLEELSHMLRSLDSADRNESIEYYREYLEDGHFTEYNDCVKELGTPRALSKQILADHSINNNGQDEHNHNSNVKTTWLIILAILASPVALLVSLPVLGLIFAIIILWGSILFAIMVSILTMGVVVLFTIPIAIARLFSDFPAGISLLGADLLVIGIILIAIPLITWLTKLTTKGIKQLSTWLYHKVTKHNYQPKGADQQ
ncbi:DUF1700 domain-containing protein [Lactobacillaceae bacterium Scapto_B20]